MKKILKTSIVFGMFAFISTLTSCSNDIELDNVIEERENNYLRSRNGYVDLNFSIMNYNVFHLPFLATGHYMEEQRYVQQADYFDNHLADLDVLVVNEAFTEYANFERLKNFKYRSGLVGKYCGGYDIGNRNDRYFDSTSSLGYCSTSPFVINGGVQIYSKHQIEYDEQLVFQNSHIKTWDFNSNKGAAYVRINKNGRKIHVIGLHLQADQGVYDGSEIRKKQIGEVYTWISSKIANGEIKKDEPIIFAGDFNVPDYDRKRVKEMTKILNTFDVKFLNSLHSYDPNNTILKALNNDKYKPQTLDYILVSKEGKLPQIFEFDGNFYSSGQKTVKVSTGGLDLSDHHAVQSNFTFRYYF